MSICQILGLWTNETEKDRENMMLSVFRLEEYFSPWEFKAPYLLCCSDAESRSLEEILALADDRSKLLWSRLHLGYTEVKGLPILRNEIAKLYQGLELENVVCFAGAEEGIFCSMQALVKEGDHVIVLTPCYQSLEDLPHHFGARVTAVRLQEENGWQMDINAIKDALTPSTRLIIINFPHNPTGAVLTDDRASALIDLARKRGIYIFSDEVFRLLGPSSTTWGPPIAVRYERGVSLGVMSKAFGLAGLRVGWIVTQDKDLLHQAEIAKHYTSICNSAPSEVLSLMALRSKDAVLGRNIEIVDKNLGLLDDFFDRHGDPFSWVRPQGGCVGFVHYKAHRPIDELVEALVHKQGVLLMPSRIYHFPGNYFRIGFGRKNMPEALVRFEAFLEEWE
jgi:aspartate/methionine/tyrosine aminotransferase